MPHGDSINAGLFFDYYWRGMCRLGYPGTQNLIILPDPGYEAGYYILHIPITTDSITLINTIDKI